MSYINFFMVFSTLSSTILFLNGFFPVTNSNNNSKASLYSLPIELKSHNQKQQTLNLNVRDLYKKHVDKLVFIVIDGLRYDFVSPEKMKYTASIIKENKCLIQVEVSPPTVTMPCLKSLMTGSISKYIDIILNFGATQVTSDSLMHQLNVNQFQTVFYGDDTWLKLFSSNSFLRYEGVNSFYVNDYLEVDTNVTRNLEFELKHCKDWDVMILHYLGLDHIGHIKNSFSPLIQSKLQEMDGIIELIHKELNKQIKDENFLLIITGDHGMRDLGGHGGSTKSETLVPLITLGNDCNTYSLSGEKLTSENKRRISMNAKVSSLNIELADKASQVDVTSTLAALLGLPFPSCNTGKLIPKLLTNLSISQLLYTYHYNVKQISDYYLESSNQNKDLNKILSDHYSLLTKKYPLHDEVLSIISDYSEFLSQVSSQIIKNSTHIDTFQVLVALVISTLGTLVTFSEPVNLSYCNIRVICLISITSYASSFFVDYSITNIFACYVLATHLNVFYEIVCQIRKRISGTSAQELQPKKRNLINTAGIQIEKPNVDSQPRIDEDHSLNLTLLSLMSMTLLCHLSTSYIENEHNIWMFVFNTFLIYILFNIKYESKRGVIIMVLALHRLLRCINMKWLDEEASISCTLSYWFQMNDSQYLNIFYTVGMISVHLSCIIIDNNHLIFGKSLVTSLKCGTITASMLSSFFHKFKYFQDYPFFISLGLAIFYLVTNLMKSFRKHTSSQELFRIFAVFTMLLSVLFFKPYNIVLISSLCLTSHLISRVLFPFQRLVVILLHLCLGRVYFFLQGSTNSIATIDITVGYLGQREYNAYIAGSLIYFNMYALNFLATLLLLYHTNPRLYANIVEINLKFVSMSSTFYLLIIYLQRHHLFIWSVFSPKLLLLTSYNLGNVLFLSFFFNVYFYLHK